LRVEHQPRPDAEAATVAMDQFLAMLGHELRNPLGAIAVAAHVLGRDASLDDDAARARDVIGRQIDTLARLVDDLLDATRVATGKITLNRRPIDLAAVTTRAVDALAQAAKTARHQVVVEAQPV